MHSTFSRAFSTLAAVAALLAGGAAQAHNVVMNGGFETGTFTGWTTSGSVSFVGVDGTTPHSGTYASYFGTVGAAATISQNLATTAGETYDVIFWLQNEADLAGTAVPNSFAFSWNGIQQLTFTNSPAFGYTKFEFSLKATSASTPIAFTFTQNPAFWDLDDVQAIPEPGSLALAGLAVGLLALQGRRRKVA